MNKRIILIGGAPTSGKSFIAAKLSMKFQIPWISTDRIRGFMRETVEQRDYPDLFYFTKQNPDKYLKNKNPIQIVYDQNRESRDVWKGVKSFIKTDSDWNVFIIEGVAVLPKFVFDFNFKKGEIKPVFILDDNKERIYIGAVYGQPRKNIPTA